MRKTLTINNGWQFTRSDKPNKTQRVNLPHSVDLTPANSSGGRNYQGECTYTYNFKVPAYAKNSRAVIELLGAMGVSRLYVNDKLAAEHYCGYTPFAADISDYISYTDKNRLTLVLDNSDNEDVPPGKAQDMLDFSYEGGLYRTAKITYLPSLYITNPLIENIPAGGGVFVWAEKVSEKSADIFVKTHVRNSSAKAQDYILSIVLSDGEGTVKAMSMNVNINGASAKETTLNFTVLSPKLWSCEEPNLYNVKVSLIQSNKITDKLDVPLGIRQFKFTYKKNLVFNGKSCRLSGGNYHQSYPYIGNAVPENALRRDAKKLRALGMENIRSHYPLADEFLDECNKLGMTMIVSNPGWQWFKEGIFSDRLIENMRSIIRWQRNNPCIILWEPIPNESVVPQEFQQKLHDAVHEEYPVACCFTASDHGPTDISYRMYDPGMLQPGMEGYNPVKRYGSKSDYPVWIREYNDAPDNWTDQNCAWRTPRGWGDEAMLKAVKRMLGKDSQCPANNYIDVYNNKIICGYGIWPAIEHNRGYHINPCWGGFLDLFRIPKFTAMFIESQRDIKDAGCVLHIASWWTDISPYDVTILSNADSVRLYHNDVLVQERKPDKIAVKHPPFTFADVHNRFKTRERSTLRAQAVVDGEVVAEKTITTPGVPTHLQLFADLEGIAPSINDIIVVRCMVLDDNGTVVPYSADNHPILFSAEGCEIIGDASIGANPVCPQAGIAAVLVKIKSSDASVTARLQWPQGNKRVAVKEASINI